MRKEFRLQAGAQPVTVSLTALFPQKLASLPDAPGTPRYPTFARETWQPATDRPAATETLPNPTRPNGSTQGSTVRAIRTPRTTPGASANPEAPVRRGTPLWLWILLALVVLAIIAALVVKSRGGGDKADPNLPPKRRLLARNLSRFPA